MAVTMRRVLSAAVLVCLAGAGIRAAILDEAKSAVPSSGAVPSVPALADQKSVRFADIQKAAERYHIKVTAKAVDWADRHVQGLDKVGEEYRLPIYYVISRLHKRLVAWRMYKPFYDRLYQNKEFAKNNPFFVNPNEEPYLVIILKDQKLTDLPPYRKFAGKTIEDVFGYAGDHRLMDNLGGEGSRGALIVSQKRLRVLPQGVYNTFYHEMGHVLHLTLLLPGELEQLEWLYAQSKRKNNFITDYAASSPSEYMACSFEAYLSETKEHEPYQNWAPYMHTRAELEKKDPDLVKFIAGLLED
ncbi:MAG: hypothetical protein PHP45_07240 [Elusimicrobiales bacterium]|nr:hypothetical protein [Elusimicrobiales bacterium]